MCIIIIANIYCILICARQYAKCFRYISSFGLTRKPLVSYFYLHLIGDKTNLGLSDLFKLPELLVVELGLKPTVVQLDTQRILNKIRERGLTLPVKFLIS